MRIAFYAPMKPPDHPVPSGDREMARLLLAALRAAGHTVEIACRLRSYDGIGDRSRQDRVRRLGRTIARGLIRRYRRRPPERRPRLWFTYHLYHKAPDWLGPPVCCALRLPYVVAEASHAARQEGGRWADGWRAAAAAIRRADLIVGLNPADEPGVRPLLAAPDRWLSLPPFTDRVRSAGGGAGAASVRAALTDARGLAPGEPVLLTVAMMRPGAKLASYRLLAAALERLLDRPWRLLVAGAGPGRADVRAALAPLGERVVDLGPKSADDLAALYAGTDLFVWPAIGEAWGMAILEAQAAGLCVVAGRSGGVADVVVDGRTGVLVTEGDAAAFAAAVAGLLDDPERRRAFGRAAAENAARRHGPATATATLDRALVGLVGRREGCR
jgi:glycosyltransferase involved in cell wall biosynthesis